jgi:antitoxin FitA
VPATSAMSDSATVETPTTATEEATSTVVATPTPVTVFINTLLQTIFARKVSTPTVLQAERRHRHWLDFVLSLSHLCASIDSRTRSRKAMPQLIVRQIEEKVVKKLKQQAGEHGVSMEEEHRRILRESLLGKAPRRTSFKEALLAMPNVGKDEDFERGPQLERPVEL